MIITRTPLRISFVGGGSDLPAFYSEEPGEVLSTTIDQFIYVSVNRKFDGRIRATYSSTEIVDRVDELKHELIRESLRHAGSHGAIEITSVSDIPSRGTGLGSSSSYTVGLLHALYAHAGREVMRETLASDACHIEIERCGRLIGKQDQYIAAYGGMQHLTFRPDGTVGVEPVRCSKATRQRIEEHLLLLYTGISRPTESILPEQARRTREHQATRAVVRRMAAFAAPLRAALEAGEADALGDFLHRNWMEKRTLTPSITSNSIDHAYETARASGASGGKLLGAGGGGFLLLYAAPERHADICRALPGLRPVPIRLEPNGTRLIYAERKRDLV